jgi:cytochrome d ubiquinol oxidase subunit I
MDLELLFRIQFAFTVAFHYIYPPLSIGLGVVLVGFEGLYLKTKNPQYAQFARFWIKIFALIFGIGVPSGIIMEFEFGTNWATYSRFVGDIFGSALAAAGIFAFALESGFLGVLLFGWNKVSPTMHLISALLVTLGSMFSAVWIVVANSWQQTPAGYHLVGHDFAVRAEITDFWAMVFNPSSDDRLLHVWVGAFLAGSFLVLSVHAYYIYKNKYVEISKKAFKVALAVATVSALLQILLGHHSAKGVAVTQPAKLAAFEGHYDNLAAADMYLVGYVNNQTEQASGIKIPGCLSFLVDGNFSSPIKGLRYFKPKDRPTAVNLVCHTYHFMVAIGLLLIASTLYASYLLLRKKLFRQKWLMLVFAFAVLLPELANQLGWYSAEVGRQPWVVYGLLRTSEALSKAVKQNEVLFSLILFTVLYVLLFTLFIYMLNKKIKHGLDDSAIVADENPTTKRDNPLMHS